MNRILKYTIGMLFLLAFVSLEAKAPEKKGEKNRKRTISTHRAQCLKSKAQTDMEINNVRAKLSTGGDLWWDGTNGKYVIPKPKPGSDAPEVSSLYAGGVWIGGYDLGDNLKVAASTFPGSSTVGYDYFTGPLDELDGTTELEQCQDWDLFFSVKGVEIDQHRLNYSKGNIDCGSIPDNVKYWPAKGNPYFNEKYDFSLPSTQAGLAGFYDREGDGIYDPCDGDYPVIRIRDCQDEIYADEMFFWVYNDQGGPHTASFGKAIQMEVQVQAFAFVSNDEINDMTFYNYRLVNRANEDLKDTYFAMWTDPDLGCGADDYIGCDTTRVTRINRATGETEIVGRDLMYVYNEDAVDGAPGISCDGVPTYQHDVPILGVDYFRGPLRPYTLVDGEFVPTNIGESADTFLEIGMSSFMYYNRGNNGNLPATEDPDDSEQYYNYLTGRWKDGTPVTNGGTGYNPGSIDTTSYVFPGDPNDNNGWSQCSTGSQSGDRRTLQVTGPLTLVPSTVNELIIGAVWVPHIDYPCPDLTKLIYADGLAQALFDNCFERVEGPDAPEMCGIELDKELILVLTNDTTELNNNAYEKYEEVDIFSKDLGGDSLYHFEGYKVFQLLNENVSVQELDDVDRARLVRQVDVKNGIGTIINWDPIDNPNGPDDIWIPTVVVEGADEGLNHTFQIVADAFAQGDNRLVNHKKYHYLVLAYGHNDREQSFDPSNPQLGQRKPYIEGVKNIKVLTLTPRPIVYRNLNAKYGDGPVITRISGQGVGDNIVDLDPSMHDAMLADGFDGRIVYKEGAGPIDIKVYDPLNVKNGKYRIELFGDSNSDCNLEGSSTWVLTNLDDNVEIVSEHTIADFSEQVLGEIGIAITIGQISDVGFSDDDGIEPDAGNGGLSGEVVYADPSGDNWFIGISDSPIPGSMFDYIGYDENSSNLKIDPKEDLVRIGNGAFTPFLMSRISNPDINGQRPWFTPSVKNGNAIKPYHDISQLNNVDIVFTSDKSKWSRCVVVERGRSEYFAVEPGIGFSGQFFPRDSESVGKDGKEDGTGKGMGYFPGYAVDVETGERLNIFFGENSSYNVESNKRKGALMDSIPLGGDMIFNPSSQVFIPGTATDGLFSQWNVVVGGHHIVYVTRQPYDECEEIASKLSGDIGKKAKALGLITWQAVPVMAEGVKMKSIEEGLIPNDVTFKMRVANPYSKVHINELGKKKCKAEGDNPVYEFELKGAASSLEVEEYEGALENVNVVPNPYYGFSAYEFTQYATNVKITNVPAKATVTIFSLDGKFIKQFKRDEVGLPCGDSSNPGIPEMQITPDIIWNLKNSKGIPVSSGVYLIHVNAPDLQEERTIKWFGVGRKFDPSGL